MFIITIYLSKEINELVAKRKAREEDIIKAGEHQQWMAKGNEDVLKDIYMQPGSYIVVPCTKYPDVGMSPFRFLLNRSAEILTHSSIS